MTPKHRKEIDAKFAPAPSPNIEQREGFTGGEWNIEDRSMSSFGIAITSDNFTVAVIEGRYRPFEVSEANASLISQAPAMYAFIKEMAERYSNSEWIAGRAKEILLKANPNHYPTKI